MAYQYITKYTAVNYTPAINCPAVFGYPRKVKSVTVHWWGTPGTTGDFYGTTAYLASKNARMVSSNYTAEAGLVACIVDPDDASWANGNSRGNAQSVTIECNPRASRADHETVAELIADLRSVYGDIPIYGHKYWTPTQCPGDYDLALLDRLARTVKSAAATAPKPIIKKDWSDMATKQEIQDAVRDELKRYLGDVIDVPKNQPTSKGNDTWTFGNALTSVWDDTNVARQNSAQTLAIVKRIAEKSGLSRGEIDNLAAAVAAQVQSTQAAEVAAQLKIGVK